MTDVRHWTPTTPTRDALEGRSWLKRNPPLLAACVALLEHGINPDAVPDPTDRPDAFTPAGILQVIGADFETGELLTERTPWPAGFTYADFLALFELPR